MLGSLLIILLMLETLLTFVDVLLTFPCCLILLLYTVLAYFCTYYFPIPKGRNVNLSDSSNYRGIALSSLYGKLFDNAPLMYFSCKLEISDLQFEFKTKHSTSQCTYEGRSNSS